MRRDGIRGVTSLAVSRWFGVETSFVRELDDTECVRERIEGVGDGGADEYDCRWSTYAVDMSTSGQRKHLCGYAVLTFNKKYG